MLSKSAARAFFLIGTVGFSVIFLLLTLDTIRRVPDQTNADNLTPQAIAGKHLWDKTTAWAATPSWARAPITRRS